MKNRRELTSVEFAGLLVASNIEAKVHDWKFFTCVRCKEMFSYKNMIKVDCFCCGSGLCKKCGEK